MRLIFVCLALLIGAGASAPVLAQQLGQVVSPILTIDRDALFQRSRFGQRVSDDLERESAALSDETRKIEQALEEEEKILTTRRATVSATEFRTLADAFDEKVVQLRADRDEAQANFLQRYDSAQRDFFNRIGPVLGRMMQERGAVALLDKRSVLLSISAIDVTEAAIARIDEALGDGSGATPQATPDTSD